MPIQLFHHLYSDSYLKAVIMISSITILNIGLLQTIDNVLGRSRRKLIEVERVGAPAGIEFDVPGPQSKLQNAIRGHDPISSASPLAEPTNSLHIVDFWARLWLFAHCRLTRVKVLRDRLVGNFGAISC